jgi:hypothetical protein
MRNVWSIFILTVLFFLIFACNKNDVSSKVDLSGNEQEANKVICNDQDEDNDNQDKKNKESDLIQWTSTEEIENMTDEQLINEVYGNNKISVMDFYEPDDFGINLEEKEWWYVIWEYNALTVVDAEEVVLLFANKHSPRSYSIDYIGENDYFFTFRLKYSIHVVRFIVYKESAFSCTSTSDVEIHVFDKCSVKNILDSVFFLWHANWASARIIYRDFYETDDEYIYTFYHTYIVSGDWGVNSTAVLGKKEIKVNKKTGKCINLFSSDYLTSFKRVEIPRTAL